MKIIHLTYPMQFPIIELPTQQVMAIGDFDGFHLGHREVIKRTILRAESLQLPASIMTFHPHPRVILGQDKYEQNLTPLEEKMNLFQEMGVQYTYVFKFDLPFARIKPETFVHDVLAQMHLETVVVGFDYSFGHEGKGTPESLAVMGQGQFNVEIVPPYHLNGEKVSSTSLREYLLNGQMEHAAQLLGRYYAIRGNVVEGEGRGRTIGFPTANIGLQEAYVIPTRGVYAVRVELGGKRYGGVMNIGVKPTFAADSGGQTLEVHLFDFQQMIYGESVQVEFVEFLRQERKFASANELIQQIQQDAREAKRILMEIV